MANLRIRKSFAAVVIGASAMVAVAAPAMATREYPGGGVWDYGRAGLGSLVYSNYYHVEKNHRSSVKVSGTVWRSSCVSPGDWSHAQAWSDISGNQAYWSNSC